MILVVDDERAITEFIADVLGEEGYSVRICHDGASALLTIYDQEPDLVLLDIGLPVMTGDTVLRELRTRGYQRLPIIITTASTNAEQYLDLGASAILKKPFTLDRLLSVVTHHLASRDL